MYIFSMPEVLEGADCNYRIYLHISHKIYDKILPEKVEATYRRRVIKLRNFFQPPKYAISNVPVTNNQYLQRRH